MSGVVHSPVASFTKEVNPRLGKYRLKANARLVNLELTPLVKDANGSTEASHHCFRLWILD